ncbi:hypothetical protein V2O64_13230 [Verrucomicrobiaceae bacterium 227]
MKGNIPVRILFDAGTRIHSEAVAGAEIDEEIQWGESIIKLPVSGYIRKPKNKNFTDIHQREVDALHTVGRLIREHRIEAYCSSEIQKELMRGRLSDPTLNALRNCEFRSCGSPVERSKFRSTINLKEYLAKGGKKDRNEEYGQFTQIAFMRWLNELTLQEREIIRSHGDQIGLTSFEIDSIAQLDCYQALSRGLRGDENLPDAFHVWTAHRHSMSFFLTLDRKLVGGVKAMQKQRNSPFSLIPQVVMPLELLSELGVAEPDPIPIENDRFYYFHEIQRAEREIETKVGLWLGLRSFFRKILRQSD